uniref:Uncharacterized protein n=1 Tax=Avena sativa TaxID=4498 RepID=A0ACD5W9C6_AVESA
MEHKGQLPSEKKGSHEEATAASSSSFFFSHPLSLMHHVVHSCAGYSGLSRLCNALKDLKPRTATSTCPAVASSQQQEEAEPGSTGHAADDGCIGVEVRSRGMPQRPRNVREGRGGTHH